MANQLLLLDDVEGLGRSGDIVKAKPGYVRNYLLPQKKAIFADQRALRIQAKLQEERGKRAVVDKQEAEKQAAHIQAMTLAIKVKVDREGHMYGSVSAGDIVHLFEKEGFQFEKRNVVLTLPIKTLGDHSVTLKLKEGVTTSFTLKVESDQEVPSIEAKKEEG